MVFWKFFNKTVDIIRPNNASKNSDVSKPTYTSDNIHKNISKIKKEMGDSDDLAVNEFESKEIDFKYAIVYLKGLVNDNTLNNLSMQVISLFNGGYTDKKSFLDTFESLLFNGKDTAESNNYEELCLYLLSGYTVILIDGRKKFIAINTFYPQGRSVGEPTSQTIIRGPKEAFTEKIEDNIALVRKRVKSTHVRVEKLTLGYISRTNVCLMYMENIAKEEIVAEIKNRLNKIKTDGVLEGGVIEQLIKDDPYSPFPTIANSEKPDTVAASVMEGKVAIYIDGTPYILLLPCLFWENFQVSEDYYHHFIVASFIRLIRYISFLLALLVPSLYIAFTSFHQEMIPTPLLISIAAQREGLPFPAFLEALIMEITFEILHEAGIRMPRAIGSAISIVGALVLGQAAVEAGIISAVMVIIVSLTAIANVTIANYEMGNAVRVTRFGFMIMAATFGLYGLFMAGIVLTLHLCKLKSIGVPYWTGVAPKVKTMNDKFIRPPSWKMKYRPPFSKELEIPKIDMEQASKSGNEKKQELR
ncbi:MAG: spore germination protein [Clostridiales bacterium]|nr:spore germination protein [Clostridiales bacterium]